MNHTSYLSQRSVFEAYKRIGNGRVMIPWQDAYDWAERHARYWQSAGYIAQVVIENGQYYVYVVDRGEMR